MKPSTCRGSANPICAAKRANGTSFARRQERRSLRCTAAGSKQCASPSDVHVPNPAAGHFLTIIIACRRHLLLLFESVLLTGDDLDALAPGRPLCFCMCMVPRRKFGASNSPRSACFAADRASRRFFCVMAFLDSMPASMAASSARCDLSVCFFAIPAS